MKSSFDIIVRVFFGMYRPTSVRRGTFMSPASPTVIRDVRVKCDRGLALMDYYCFEFKDTAEQGICGFLTSLVAQSDNHALAECLTMLMNPPTSQLVTHFIADALAYHHSDRTMRR